jgi:hypothetical protein
MRSLPVVVLAAGLTLPVAPLFAQDPSAGQAGSGDPLELLLGIAEALDLSTVQVARIREIQGDLEERNRPLVDRLVEVQRRVRAQLASSVGRDAVRRRPTDTELDIARPPLRQIRINNREAMEEVGAILTNEQKRRAAELLDLDGYERRWRGRASP